MPRRARRYKEIARTKIKASRASAFRRDKADCGLPRSDCAHAGVSNWLFISDSYKSALIYCVLAARADGFYTSQLQSADGTIILVIIGHLIREEICGGSGWLFASKILRAKWT